MARRFTSPYSSEDEELLQIRRDRDRASDLSLTPSNVRRVYGSVRTPTAPRMAEPPRARSADAILDGALRDYFPGGRVRSPAGVGAGTTDRSTVPAGTTGVGVGTVADDPQPSTSRSNPPAGRRAGTSAAALASRSVSGGKEPRRSVARTVAEVRRRVQRDAGGGGGGDDDDDGGGGSDGSRRSRRGSNGSRRSRRGSNDSRRSRRGRDLHNDLDALFDRLRRRTGGRRIAGITHTDTITTTYKDGGPPTVSRSSYRTSGESGDSSA